MHDSLKEFAAFFDVAETPVVEYYVYYNPENGAIDKIQTRLQEQGEYIVVPENNTYIQNILDSKSSENDYIVAFDKEQDTKGLFKKDTFLRKLHSNNDNLYGIPFKAEADYEDQVNLNFHLNTKRLEIAVNRSALENLLKAVRTERIYVQTEDDIVFYLVDKYDPNTIYETIVCDPNELLNNRLNFKLDWLTEEKLNRMIVWTKRFFHSYSWSWQAKQFVTPIADGCIYSINTGHESESTDCHLRLQFTSKGVTITSNIKDPNKVRFYEPLAVHMIRSNDPSKYYGTFGIPPAEVANGKTYTIDYVRPIDNLDIIFDNTNLRIHWTIE
jgi:hypothetical protein